MNTATIRPQTLTSLTTLTFARTFTTTQPCHGHASKTLARIHKDIPPYPFPRKRWYNQSNFGLYSGLKIQHGAVASERTRIKNLRTWKPNIQLKHLYSAALKKYIRVKVATRTLRTIDKVGGLDEYLLGEKSRRVRDLGMGGWALRWRLMRSPVGRERMSREREALGLTGPGPWEEGWVDPYSMEVDGEITVDEEVLVSRERDIDAILDQDGVEVELEDFEAEKPMKV